MKSLSNKAPALLRQSQRDTVKEIALVALGIVLLSFAYSMPRLITGARIAPYLEELMMDCIFMFVASLPGWWLHFYGYRFSGVRKRMLLHMVSGTIFYGIWVLCYRVYNPLIGRPAISPVQILQNFGPNILFYLQIFSFLHIYHFFRQREMQMKHEKELKELEYNVEISALKAQIQPHFLFNTLNSISASVPTQHESTRELIAQLADTFRYALTASQEDKVPLWQELDFLRTYLSLEHQRFGKRLEAQIKADEAVNHLMIPPMLLQPLVENALKHGIEPSVQGGSICISCCREGQKVNISVYNTGIAYNGTLHDMLANGGVGLQNISQRLEKLYGEKLRLIRKEHGLCFSFSLPVT